jgi:hypothetical protein
MEKVTIWQLKNFKPKNIFHTIQGHYRAFIVREYNKFNNDQKIVDKVVKYSKCMGNCKSCGCPLTELILSNKNCDICQTL